MKLFKWLKLPQYNTGRAIGGFLDTYQRSATVVNTIQYVVMIIVLYTTSAQPFLNTYFPWITFPVYLGIAFVIVVVALIGTYMVMSPSTYSFWNQQVWKHDNPWREKLELLEKVQEEMRRNQKKIMEKLGVDDTE